MNKECKMLFDCLIPVVLFMISVFFFSINRTLISRKSMGHLSMLSFSTVILPVSVKP